MTRVLPLIEELVGRHPERTVFTRFMTPNKATDMPGMWQRYYARWKQTTREYPPWPDAFARAVQPAGHGDR